MAIPRRNVGEAFRLPLHPYCEAGFREGRPLPYIFYRMCSQEGKGDSQIGLPRGERCQPNRLTDEECGQKPICSVLTRKLYCVRV